MANGDRDDVAPPAFFVMPVPLLCLGLTALR